MANLGFLIVGGMRVKRVTHHTKYVLILSHKMSSAYLSSKVCRTHVGELTRAITVCVEG
jgi:hypothetical protein